MERVSQKEHKKANSKANKQNTYFNTKAAQAEVVLDEEKVQKHNLEIVQQGTQNHQISISTLLYLLLFCHDHFVNFSASFSCFLTPINVLCIFQMYTRKMT